MNNPYDYDEKRLRDEVIYLHYLWQQGPPPPPPQPQHTWHVRPRPPQPAPARTRSLPSATFKKQKNHHKDPGSRWPCPVGPDPSPAWAAEPKPDPPPRPDASPEEKEKLAAMQAQHKACKALKEFLSNHDDDDDDDDGECEEVEEFFLALFTENHDLRGYYQRRYESGGEFCCLVCDAVGKKNSGKRFKDCVGLLQHSRSILRTAKKMVHRGFGMALCRVLGWDYNRLPTIVVKGTPLGMEGEPKASNAANDNDRKDGSHESDDKVMSLEYGDVAVEVPAQGVDQSIIKTQGEPKEEVEDDGENGAHKSGDEVVSLRLGDEPVKEHVQGVDQSINEVNCL